MDTLRADHLSQYGYAHDTSPGLAEFARQSTLFRNAYAPAPWTIPSTASLLTGLSPIRHGSLERGSTLSTEPATLAGLAVRKVNGLFAQVDG